MMTKYSQLTHRGMLLIAFWAVLTMACGSSAANALDEDLLADAFQVEITFQGRTTQTDNPARALSRLRGLAKRPQSESPIVKIHVKETTQTYHDINSAAAACEDLAEVRSLARRFKITLDDVGSLEDLRQAPDNQQQDDSHNEQIQLPPPQRSRDGDDGLGGIGGGLGGPGGGVNLQTAKPPRRATRSSRPRDRDTALTQIQERLRRILQEKDHKIRDTPIRTATLLSRMHHRDYQKATYSFEFGIRDDPRNQIGNDWDLQYGNGGNHFHVAMVADDLSRMLDLGENNWEQLDLSRLPELAPNPRPRREMIPAVKGHMYLVHTVDRNTDLLALFRVEDLRQDGACDITWKLLRKDKPETVRASQ